MLHRRPLLRSYPTAVGAEPIGEQTWLSHLREWGVCCGGEHWDRHSALAPAPFTPPGPSVGLSTIFFFALRTALATLQPPSVTPHPPSVTVQHALSPGDSMWGACQK